jgi:hypothetical protein
MSGTDYTKKAINGNSREESNRLAIWWYELVFLYKSRAEKWLMAIVLIVLAFSWVGMAYLAKVFETPADIVECNDPA